MFRINIYQAKTHLSRYLSELRQGDVIVICKRNVPIAEIHPLSPPPTQPRPVGKARGEFDVPEEFFEPLPEELLSRFEGDR